MNPCDKEAVVSLRIASRVRSVSDITQAVGVPPSKSVEKGELMSKRSRVPKYREESLWFIGSGLLPSAPIEDHLQKITEFIDVHLSSLQPLSADCDIGVYCNFTICTGQGGFVLTNELLQKLLRLPLDLWVDLFSVSSSDEATQNPGER